jgi:ABC-type multidrug transport system ATPase subunit
MNKLVISDLSKTYSNGVKALNSISLNISEGMFGLLGPNGAGKSTLMRTIATLQEPDEGTITFAGIDVLEDKNTIRKNLGYLPQEFGLYPKITAEVLLNHLAVLKGITKKAERSDLIKSLLHKTNLYNDRKKNLGTYSGGMKQRFGIAQALLSDPKLLIVDEPTAGLDPSERNRFHNLLCDLSENTVVILSTHIVDDVKELCADMAIINEGSVLLQGEPLKLIDELRGKIYKKRIERNEVEDYRANFDVISDRLLLGESVIHIYAETSPGNEFELVSAELEDVYFSQISLS